MKIGDLVKKVKSPGDMTGVIVGWHEDIGYRLPVVLWANGRWGWVVPMAVKPV